jgi:hypothetical protein
MNVKKVSVSVPKLISETGSETVKCDKCLKTFSNIYVYQRHQNKKIPCDTVALKSYKMQKKKCIFCSKIMCSYNSARNHMNICKRKDDPIIDSDGEKSESESEKDKVAELHKLISQMNADNIQLKEDNKRIYAMIEQMNHATETHTNSHNPNNSHNNNSNNNNTVNNIQQTINLVAYGKEKYDHISDAEFTKIIKKGFMSVPSFIETLHFNKEKPEYHNIYISNMRDNYVLRFDGIKWGLADKSEVLQDILDSRSSVLSEKFDELYEHLDEPTKTRFERFLNEVDTDRTKHQIKTELKMILYNNKKIPEQTRALIDQN